MEIELKSMKSWGHSLNDVTKLCLAAATGSFLVGGVLVLSDNVAPRGIALLAVGGFFLVQGLFEFAKHRWQAAAAARAKRTPLRAPTQQLNRQAPPEPSEQAAA
jgi:hypothetical protein